MGRCLQIRGYPFCETCGRKAFIGTLKPREPPKPQTPSGPVNVVIEKKKPVVKSVSNSSPTTATVRSFEC